MNTLQDDFKEKVGIAVSEVFKGGSLGHGTQVPQKYDIDLVLYSESTYIATCMCMVTTYSVLHALHSPSPFIHNPLTLSLFLSLFLFITTTALKDKQDKVVRDGCGEWLAKTTDFLKTHTDGRCSDFDIHLFKDIVVGIRFIYSFNESKEEISVDLFLSPNFSSLDELLKFLRDRDKQKRIQ